jgi:hypothetical protein
VITCALGCQQASDAAPNPAPLSAPAPAYAPPPPSPPSPPPSTPSPPSTPPPAASCPPPSPARDKQIRARINQTFARDKIASAPEITPVCEEQGGWLVSVAYAEPSGVDYSVDKLDDGRIRALWRVSDKGAWPVGEWTLGPTLDFDGDGKPEASTWYTNHQELKIWFAGGRKAAYVTLPMPIHFEPADGERWTRLDGYPVWLSGVGDDMHGFRFRPDHGRDELSPADCARAAGQPCASTPIQRGAQGEYYHSDPLSDTGAAVLGHRKTGAICAQLDDATKARIGNAIEQDELRNSDPNGVITEVVLTWGCTSHGETQVSLEATDHHDGSASAWYSVRGEQITAVRGAWQAAPDEYADRSSVYIVGHADLDGDGFDESIIVEAAGRPEGARYTVRIAGQLHELPSSQIYRGADGARDGIVRLRPFARRAGRVRCDPTEPLGCLGLPPVGWWVRSNDESWDWEHDRPEILVLRGGQLVPLAKPALDAIISETAAPRAQLLKPATK